MIRIHHLNCGTLLVPNYPTVVCHCLLLEDPRGLALVDTGIGLLDVQSPLERLGQPLIEMAGFQFNEHDTAVRRMEKLGFSPNDVRHIILTHCDPDHAGGLADFPHATVHLAEEELANVQSGSLRYIPTQFAHSPRWQTISQSQYDWWGLSARSVPLGFSSEVLLVPLFGHTAGHCGVAIRQDKQWMLHAGDAYYLRAELTTDDHPVSVLAAARADDDHARRVSLGQLRRLNNELSDVVQIIGYHDLTELSNGLNE
ncbi:MULTISPECIES: MBL fold metallo-hydrolase [unclassified Schlesneria]|uniref:MBL fold metallo-hydrolase n=1 Tax=unclassified Schlesneria TaxID=2762017 RepID=UPI002EFBDF6D